MTTEITRVGILSAGKVSALVYGFFTLIFLPFILIGFIVSPAESLFLAFMVLLYPIMGLVFGMLFAALYNLAAKLAGGLRFDLEQVSDGRACVTPGGPAAVAPLQ